MAAGDEVDEITKCFLGYEVKYVRRDDNTAADMLSKLGSGRKPIPPGIFLENLRVPSVKGANPENPDRVSRLSDGNHSSLDSAVSGLSH
ncbi:hypothetical protein QYE76_064484 [Lolium multiflorum]|uniref:Uncharacterized protein n=1 Tax=Lolium multiflorum TaxID=4521 RepID=A0AAD8S6X7_LOLMU|nr:hypothetical protein QYE76_064484 [Lolium multiflorum]